MLIRRWRQRRRLPLPLPLLLPSAKQSVVQLLPLPQDDQSQMQRLGRG